MSYTLNLLKEMLNLINQNLTQNSHIFEIGTAHNTYSDIIYP